MKKGFNKFIIFLAILLLSLTIYVALTKKPKQEEKQNINTIKTREIKENDEIYNITLSTLKHCNYGENNINKESYNNYLYKDNYTLDTMSLDQKFYCILSFVTKDDLGIKDDFDRKQLSTKIPTPLIQEKIKSYKQVEGFLDNDDAGRKSFAVSRQMFPQVVDGATRYRAHKDLNEWLVSQSKVQESQPSLPTTKRSIRR